MKTKYNMDTDTKMLHVIMKLVTDFVNTEMHKWSPKDFKKECDRIKKEDGVYAPKNLKRMILQYDTDQKIISIAKWWNNYDNRHKEIDRARKCWTCYYKKFIKDKEEVLGFQTARKLMNNKEKNKEQLLFKNIITLESKLYKEEQKMLKLAIETREAMWS